MYDPENELEIPKQSWRKFRFSVLWNCGYFYGGVFLPFCLFVCLVFLVGWLLGWLGFVCLCGLGFFFVGWVLVFCCLVFF